MPIPQRKIFISYRRQDHGDFVERIRDWFIHQYGRENVFMDFDTIPPLVKFSDFIRQEVERCDVMLVIIGPRWVELLREKAANFEDDFVRIEIGLALELGKQVAPICIMDAEIPKTTQLPNELRPLLDYNAAFLNNGREFLDNIDRILEAVGGALGSMADYSTPDASTQASHEKSNELEPGTQTLLGIAYLALGRTFFYLGITDLAIRFYTEGVRYRPQSARSHRLLGDCYYQKQQYNEALTAYRRALDVSAHKDPLLVDQVKALEARIKP